MALTVGNAIKAVLEAASIGVPIFRDRAPQGLARPYITISEGISSFPHEAFNQHDDDEGHVRELVQVDLWQDYRAADKTVAEDYALSDRMRRALQGPVVSVSVPFGITAVRIESGPERLLEVDANVVHHALTLEVIRTTERN